MHFRSFNCRVFQQNWSKPDFATRPSDFRSTPNIRHRPRSRNAWYGADKVANYDAQKRTAL